MKKTFKNVVSGSIAGVVSRSLEAVIKFATLPILLKQFGKLDYGLIELVVATNTYVQLLDMGLNIGSVKYFSQWISTSKYRTLINVSQSNIVFYSIIGSVNVIVLLLLGSFPEAVFKVSPDRVSTFRYLFYTISISALVNWLMHTVNQLLLASENIAWVHFMGFIRSAAGLCSALLAVYLDLTIIEYFWLFTILGLTYIPLSVIKLRAINAKIKVLWYLAPSWHWKDFKIVYRYGLAVFLLGMLQFSANNLRPILLGMVSPDTGILTEFRVIQNISSLLSVFGSVFIMSMLPASSKLTRDQDIHARQTLLVKGTRYVTFFLSFVLLPVAVLRSEFLYLYVGEQFLHLDDLVVVMCLTMLFQIHLSAVVSMIYAIGRLREIVAFTLVSAVVSLTITALLGMEYGVAAAVCAFTVYIVMQLIFYYIYYIPKVIKSDPWEIFARGFLPGYLVWMLGFIMLTAISEFIVFEELLWTLSFYFILTILVYAAVAWFFVTEEEKHVILKLVRGVFGGRA